MVTVDEMRKVLNGLEIGKEEVRTDYIELKHAFSWATLRTVQEMEEEFVAALEPLTPKVVRPLFKGALDLILAQDKSHAAALKTLLTEVVVDETIPEAQRVEFVKMWARHLIVDEGTHIALIDLLLDELARMELKQT